MLRGCHHAAPASQTTVEVAKHLPQHIEYYNVCGSFWTTADERVPRSGMQYSTNQLSLAYAIVH